MSFELVGQKRRAPNGLCPEEPSSPIRLPGTFGQGIEGEYPSAGLTAYGGKGLFVPVLMAMFVADDRPFSALGIVIVDTSFP